MALFQKTSEAVAVSCFFLALLLIGSIIYDNYGVHWDEYHNQRFGKKWVTYVQKSIEAAYPLKLNFSDRKENRKNRDFAIIEGSDPFEIKICEHDLSHGPIFEMLLSIVTTRTASVDGDRDLIFKRHFCLFLFFLVSVIAFHFFVKHVFGSWKFGLLGCFFLVLSPRIFSHSFFNSVDIAFLSLYILSAFSLTKFIQNKSYFSGLIHALICAILIDVRTIGLVVPVCTYLFYGLDLFHDEGKAASAKKLVFYSVMLGLLTFSFWPYLWSSPFYNFIEALRGSTFYSPTENSPWYYNGYWIVVTTPLLYSLLFGVGLLWATVSFAKAPYSYYLKHKNHLIYISLLFIPILLPVLFRTHLYDGWRHHYFVYPVFILIALIGVDRIAVWLKNIETPATRAITSMVCLVMLACQLAWIGLFIFRHHPHENNYANFLAMQNTDGLREGGAIDYWGLSYRHLLEHILRTDEADRIKVGYYNKPGRINSAALPPSQKSRLEFISMKRQKDDLPDYIVTTFRRVHTVHPDFYGFLSKNSYQEYYALIIDGVKISAIYKKQSAARQS